MKSVHIRSFFSSVFSFIPTKYGDLQSKSPYSVRRQENTDQKKLLIRTLFTQRVTPQNKGSTKKDFSHLYFPAWVKVTSNNPHWKFKRLWNETFMGFLRQSARQELYGFSLRVNHLWFKLEKNPFLCTTVLHHWGVQLSFDKPLQESQWILHYLAELH